MSPRVFSVIRTRPGASIKSGLSAMRKNRKQNDKKIAEMATLIASMKEAELPRDEIDALEHEREYYICLFMTPDEQNQLRGALQDNGLPSTVFSSTAAGMVFYDDSPIHDVENPVKALQTALDVHKGVINFNGAVEILYHDSYESSWLIIKDSIVREEFGIVDVEDALRNKPK